MKAGADVAALFDGAGEASVLFDRGLVNLYQHCCYGGHPGSIELAISTPRAFMNATQRAAGPLHAIDRVMLKGTLAGVVTGLFGNKGFIK